MRFCEKLDFLMTITKTTNSALSRQVNLDASHISRLRRGQRNAPNNKTYTKSMSEYFAKRCVEDYQLKALFDIMGVKSLVFENEPISELIAQWLINEQNSETKTVNNFLIDFSNTKMKQVSPAYNHTKNQLSKELISGMSVYYGLEGKRKAVISFLSEVLSCQKPQILLLFSDETTDWMTTDPLFMAKWASLMSQVILKGHRIKIIHTVSRNLDEMLSAINQWMPLYLSGAIEPYFYPKKRDGVFKRTIFIAPDCAAVVSNSVGNMDSHTANFLLKKTEIIAAFMEEYNQYLSLCKPLMRIFTDDDEQAYMNTLLKFEKEQANTIIKTEALSMLTMPEVVAAKILSRNSSKNDLFLDYHRVRAQYFRNNIEANSVTEIIFLADFETVINQKLKISFSNMFHNNSAYYTVEEYILHLENVVQLLKTYKNFHVYLAEEHNENHYMVYVKDDLGALVIKTSSPAVAIALNEGNMTAAFWDFLKNSIGDKAYASPNNQKTADKLCDYIKQLKKRSADHSLGKNEVAV